MSQNDMPKMTTVSFYAPHWELVFRGILVVGHFSAKTRQNESFRHRGPVLCYTSRKAHTGPVRAHRMQDTNIPRGVVGCANIVDVRELTDEEKEELFRGYNNSFTAEEMERLGVDAIYPMPFGYIMDKVYPFQTPFIPPEQHMYGPIGAMPLYPEIRKQLPNWACS